jgi:hypothetical protein
MIGADAANVVRLRSSPSTASAVRRRARIIIADTK